MAQIEALVTPAVMKWARERARLSLEDAAERIKRPVSEIADWESGRSRPSIAQARKTSEVYKRPLAVFYLPEPPGDFETLRDFRSLTDAALREYNQELALVIRQTKYRQEWTRDFLLSEGAEKLSFIGSCSLRDPPVKVAESIMQTLQMRSEEQQECQTRDEALMVWILKTETAGVFVFRHGHIDLAEARGFVMVDEYAPFVFLNSEDAKAAQMFTLLHELAHLWINAEGLSNLEPFTGNTSRDVQEVERFCNKIAAQALLDPVAFDKAWSKQTASVSIEDRIEAMSLAFKVSEEAVARRLLDKGIINEAKYLELRAQYQMRWRDMKDHQYAKMKAAEGGPSYYVRKAFNDGYSFTQTVISAYDAGSVSGVEASGLLDVKVNHLGRLAMEVGLPVLKKAGVS